MMLVGLHATAKFPNVPTNFQMYRQNSEKAFLGGGGGGSCPPCTSSGYDDAPRFENCHWNCHWKTPLDYRIWILQLNFEISLHDSNLRTHTPTYTIISMISNYRIFILIVNYALVRKPSKTELEVKWTIISLIKESFHKPLCRLGEWKVILGT